MRLFIIAGVDRALNARTRSTVFPTKKTRLPARKWRNSNMECDTLSPTGMALNVHYRVVDIKHVSDIYQIVDNGRRTTPGRSTVETA